jgi:hypothetical protein
VLVSIKEFSAYKLNQKQTLLANLLENAKNLTLLEKITKDLYTLQALGDVRQAHAYCDKVYTQLRITNSKQHQNQIQKRVHLQQKRINEIHIQEVSENETKYSEKILERMPATQAHTLPLQKSESLTQRLFKIVFISAIVLITLVQ